MNKMIYMLLFALMFFTIIGLIHFYIWVRLVKDMALPAPWRQLATGAVIALGVSIPFTFFVGRALSFSVAKYLNLGPFVWMGMMMLFFFAFLSIDLVKLGVFAVNKMRSVDDTLTDPSRRAAMGRLIAGSTAAVVGGLSTAAVVQAAKKISVEKISIGIANLPAPFEGLKVVQISDIHIGETKGREWFTDLVNQVNALKPDIVAVTGDLVDGTVEQIGDEVRPIGGLTAKQGVYFVTGNHEYYSEVGGWMPFIESLGIKILRNEHVAIGGGEDILYLAGVDDYKAKGMAPGHGADMGKALKGRDEGKPVVLLAHQPAAAIEAGEMGVDLVLSGHTHGGQIWPFTYLVGLQQPYNKGLYQHNEKTQVYVNQGTGLWGPPMRLGTKCEITYITLKKA